MNGLLVKCQTLNQDGSTRNCFSTALRNCSSSPQRPVMPLYDGHSSYYTPNAIAEAVKKV